MEKILLSLKYLHRKIDYILDKVFGIKAEEDLPIIDIDEEEKSLLERYKKKYK